MEFYLIKRFENLPFFFLINCVFAIMSLKEAKRMKEINFIGCVCIYKEHMTAGQKILIMSYKYFQTIFKNI